MPILAAFIAPHPPIIIPQIGRGEEKKIQSTTNALHSMGQRMGELKPQTIIVISPHSIMYADYIHISPFLHARGDLGGFHAQEIVFEKKYDAEFVSALSKEATKAGIPAGTQGERDASLDHGVMVPLYFVDQYYTDYDLVRISISGLSPLEHYRFGQCIAKAAEQLDRRIVIIASGDLSHKLRKSGPYGYAAEGPQFDAQITQAMASGDFLQFMTFNEEFCEASAECGLRSFIEMSGALDSVAVSSSLLSYEGPFGVGYAVCSYEIIGPDESRNFGEQLNNKIEKRVYKIRGTEDEFVRLARHTLETYIRTGKRIQVPPGLSPALMHHRAGVFVSIKKDGRLRGCIGTITATESSIADEIVLNAISSGTRDPRFEAVTEEELDSLEYSVDVLGEAEPVTSTEVLDVKRFGVIVSSGSRRGLLLPNLEGVDTPEQQISIAKQKAGIGSDEPYSLQRFEVVRHK